MHQPVVPVRERGPYPLEEARHPRALVVVARLPCARADTAADDQYVDTLAWAVITMSRVDDCCESAFGRR